MNVIHKENAMKRSWTDEALIESVKLNKSYAGVIRNLGFKVSGGMHRFIKGHVLRLGLDTSHFTGSGHLKNKTHTWSKRLGLNEVMTKNSTYSPALLKSRLMKEGFLKNECSKCGQGPSWNDNKLTLQLDHINGDHFDNRFENLRILCPNCHSQTPTFGSKNRVRSVSIEKTISNNQDRKQKATKIKTSPDPNWRFRERPHLRKVERPNKEELQDLIKNNTWVDLGKMFGVSDNAVRKWARKYKLL